MYEKDKQQGTKPVELEQHQLKYEIQNQKNLSDFITILPVKS